jgi:hypothetical protein
MATRNSSVSGTSITSSAKSSNYSISFHLQWQLPFLFLLLLLEYWKLFFRVQKWFVAINTTGIFSSIKAIGPCFISAAGYPSAWIYEISLSFKAPSNATGKLRPLRPRYKESFWRLYTLAAISIIRSSAFKS